MRKLLKKSLMTIMSMFMLSATAVAGNDKPISISQLPATAQHTINKNFHGRKVALAKVDAGFFDKSYDVVFTNGDKIEFDSKGNWTEITCKRSKVPATLIPAAIRNYVRNNYPGSYVKQLEKSRYEYEVKLSNGLEITFNNKFQVTDIDD